VTRPQQAVREDALVVLPGEARRPLRELERDGADRVVEVRDLTRSFGGTVALNGVSFTAREGQIQAVVGPNGAGKTTLLRILSGLLEPSGGEVRVLGMNAAESPRELRQLIGLVPSGDRSFYLRLSGLENLLFFARLYGLKRREAVARARDVLGTVGLLDAANKRVAFYSHGMQKRLSIARALLTDPTLLIVDEGTHDLDPAGARDVRDLVRAAAAGRGVTVVWATQRLDELPDFADSLVLLNRGELRFEGTVSELMAHAPPERFVLRLAKGRLGGEALQAELEATLARAGSISRSRTDRDEFVLSLGRGVSLGAALQLLLAAGISVLACREKQSGIEGAFLSLTGEPIE
jgi:ABC-2 type transport system ATP-binding protein